MWQQQATIDQRLTRLPARTGLRLGEALALVERGAPQRAKIGTTYVELSARARCGTGPRPGPGSPDRAPCNLSEPLPTRRGPSGLTATRARA